MAKSINRLLAELLDNETGAVHEEYKDEIIPRLTTYESLDSLPYTNLTTGDQAFVKSNQRMYISNGSGWYNVALVNASPSLSISPTGAITLATDGTPTVITLTGTDSDQVNLTFTVESDGDFGGLATLSQDSSVFTITPLSEDSATTTSSTLTFKTSDGINFDTGTSVLSLSFLASFLGSENTAKPLYDSDLRIAGTYSYMGQGSASKISPDGQWAVVGAPNTGGVVAGAVYIFSKSGGLNGDWQQEQKIVDPVPADIMGYGWVDITNNGSYVFIGVPNDDGASDTASASGRVEVYAKSGSTWSLDATIRPTDLAASDRFGFAGGVDYNGDRIAVSAYSQDYNVNGAGAIYTFTRSGSTWTQEAKFQHSDPANFDSMSQRMTMSRDGLRIIAGSIFKSPGGAAYIFSRSGSTWTQEAKLTGDGTSGAQFGGTVSISNDGLYAIVGAYNEDKAWIYSRSGSTWSLQQKIDYTSLNNDFSRSVGINSTGEWAIISAPEDDSAGTNEGAVYVYNRDNTEWTLNAKVFHPNNTSASFGMLYNDHQYLSIDSDGSTFLAGSGGKVEVSDASNLSVVWAFSSS